MFFTRRRLWAYWFCAIAILFTLVLLPVSTRMIRAACVASFTLIWLGSVALVWRRASLRGGLLALSVAGVGFLLWPVDRPTDVDALRSAYLASLRRYEGVRYHWGGEGFTGIDCSGLVRRGLIDALVQQSARRLDPAAARRALALWWNDSSAEALGEAKPHLTDRLFETSSLNALDHSTLLPGDLAVTQSGIHILAYLGNRQWIEADPLVSRVITLRVPSDNPWLDGPMRIVRWIDLRQ